MACYDVRLFVSGVAELGDDTIYNIVRRNFPWGELSAVAYLWEKSRAHVPMASITGDRMRASSWTLHASPLLEEEGVRRAGNLPLRNVGARLTRP